MSEPAPIPYTTVPKCPKCATALHRVSRECSSGSERWTAPAAAWSCDPDTGDLWIRCPACRHALAMRPADYVEPPTEPLWTRSTGALRPESTPGTNPHPGRPASPPITGLPHIMFRADMVRAILAGEKCVTRRRMKLPSGYDFDEIVEARAHVHETDRRWVFWCDPRPGFTLTPQWTPGRRLWVREAWRTLEQDDGTDGVFFPADGAFVPIPNTPEAADLWGAAHANGKHGKNHRPSLLMPRWASRITLRVTDVRAERLTEITAEDVAAEGLVHAGLGDTPADYCRLYRGMHKVADDADPWVWRIAFEVVDPNPRRANRPDFQPYQRPEK